MTPAPTHDASGDARAPRVLRVDRDAPDGDAIRAAAEVIRGGGLVAFPTETLYGLAADPWSEAAVARLFAAKGRPEGKGVPVIVADLAAAARLAPDFPEAARALAERYWPGPLTIVVPARASLPRGVAPDGVALRRSSCALAERLARAAGGAVTATSANRSGDPTPPLDPRRILERIGDRIDLLLDAGPLPESPASTVVDARVSPPRLLRRGPIDLGPDVAPAPAPAPEP